MVRPRLQSLRIFRKKKRLLNIFKALQNVKNKHTYEK